MAGEAAPVDSCGAKIFRCAGTSPCTMTLLFLAIVAGTAVALAYPGASVVIKGTAGGVLLVFSAFMIYAKRMQVAAPDLAPVEALAPVGPQKTPRELFIDALGGQRVFEDLPDFNVKMVSGGHPSYSSKQVWTLPRPIAKGRFQYEEQWLDVIVIRFIEKRPGKEVSLDSDGGHIAMFYARDFVLGRAGPDCDWAQLGGSELFRHAAYWNQRIGSYLVTGSDSNGLYPGLAAIRALVTGTHHDCVLGTDPISFTHKPPVASASATEGSSAASAGPAAASGPDGLSDLI